MAYPTFPMQYPTHSEGMAPMGLIPVELDIEGLYEDHDRRRRKNGSEKVVASHVHSVCPGPTFSLRAASNLPQDSSANIVPAASPRPKPSFTTRLQGSEREAHEGSRAEIE